MFNSKAISESVSKTPVHMIIFIEKGLWAILLLMIINNVTAQDSKSPKLSMGIEIGPSVTTLYGDPDYNYQSFPACGVSGGLAFQVFINKFLSFKTSYLFQLKNEKTKDYQLVDNDLLKSSGTNFERSHFYYLGIPILLQFNFGRKVGCFINIGPNLNFLLKGEKVVNTNSSSELKSTSAANKIDFGITAGIGLLLPLKENYALTIEARNNFGLKPIYNDQQSKFYSFEILIGFSIFNHN